MKFETYLDHATILANEARPVHFAVRLRAESITQPRPVPAAFCVVLDRSGSMQGEPLARAREAAALAVRNLRPEDQLALVVFDDAAQTILPLQRVCDRTAVLSRIRQMEPGGSTNLTAGWMLGRDALREAPEGAQRRLLLLSDGHLNHGIVEPPLVRAIVLAGLEQDGIRTSALGFGLNYNEDLMAELARVTNGEFYDASSPEKFPAIFAEELDGLQKVAVQNLRLRLRRLPFCERFQPLGEYPAVERPDGAVEFALGDLVSDEERIVCFGVEVLPLPLVNARPAFDLAGEELLALEVLFDEVTPDGIASRQVTQTIRIRATQDQAEVRQNGEVVQWVSVQRAGKVTSEVARLMDVGRAEEAVALLERSLALLAGLGGGPGVLDAVRSLTALRDRIIHGGWNALERKLSKYRSSAYMKMSSKPFWSSNEPPPSFKQGSQQKTIQDLLDEASGKTPPTE